MSLDTTAYGASGYEGAGYKRTATAMFDNKPAAEKAIADLVAAGIPRGDINLVEGGSNAAAAGGSRNDTGFWESLKDIFLPEEDRYSYAEGLRRGGYLLSVRVNEDRYNQALEILDQDHTVDMNQRETAWRSEGWAGYTPGTARTGTEATSGSAALGASTLASNTGRASGSGTQANTTNIADRTTAFDSGRGTAPSAGQDEVIPIVQENLQVGKRDVNHGRVRVRSYVVESPVNEQVNLRREHVEVERRPVDRAVTAADEALFRERTIEAVQHGEEAVVSKEARVTEEIALRKNVEQQTETISDTVRRTEVEVEDERGNVVGGKTNRAG
jgi:uncharacterized protein (TIGR02271 family)